MTDQKRENLLNLALAATEVERRRVQNAAKNPNCAFLHFPGNFQIHFRLEIFPQPKKEQKKQ